MFILGNDTTVRIINTATGDTEKLIQGKLDVTNTDKSVTLSISDSIELENDNLNIYEEEKKLRMKSLQKLLDENKHYYINRHCFGEYYGEEEIESYNCDQCGDWNGSWGDGSFKELFLGDVTSQLEYSYAITIEELEIKDLFEVDEFDNYILKDESVRVEVLDKLMDHSSLYSNNVCFTVENESFSIPMNEVPEEYIKEALIQLTTKNED